MSLRNHLLTKDAVCLFGEPPTVVVPWWATLKRADVFFHFYSYRTVGGVRVPLSESEKDALVRAIRPQRFVFDDGQVEPADLLLALNRDKRFYHDQEPRGPADMGSAALFYSLMLSANLRRSHEIFRDHQYRRCIAAHTSVTPKFEALPNPLPRSIHSARNGYDTTEHLYTTSPLFFFADSPTFDMLASHYRFKRCYKEFMFRAPSRDVIFNFHISALNIENYPTAGIEL